MKRISVLRSRFIILFCCFISITAFSQNQFFRSGPSLSSEQLKDFYSSFTIDNGTIYFIASDYFIYAYDKTSGKELWNHSLSFKTRTPCFVSGELVYVPYYKEKHSYTAQLNATTGQFVKLLPVGPLQTKPIIKDDILFGTAIVDAGSIFAYDIKNDSLLWCRFIAHGMSAQPYYFPGYIHANAEFDHWVRLNYKGELIDTICKDKASIFVRDIPCIRDFLSLTHDGAELKEEFSKKLFGDDDVISPDNTLRGRQHSFVLHEDQLAVIGKKGKLIKLINLHSLLGKNTPDQEIGLTQLLDTDEETVSFTWLNLFIRYNFKTNKLEKQVDLSAWNPSQVVLEKDNIWLISRKDGLLYGLTI